MARATPLPPDERRAALMAATEPLLERYGREISTRQIAEAAGVAEGTIFRAFPTKEALIDACLEEAFNVEVSCEQLMALDPSLGFEECILAAVSVLQDRLRRVIALFHAIRMPSTSPEQVGYMRARHSEDAEKMTMALTAVLTPHADRLRRSPAGAAAVIRTVVFSMSHPMISGDQPSSPEDIVDLLLHGLLRGTPPPPVPDELLLQGLVLGPDPTVSAQEATTC